MQRTGKVYIVGAGPGDPGLLTVRAIRLLQRADMVFYDRLVHPLILQMVRPGCRRIGVGHTAGQPGIRLSALVRRMAAACRRGATVVRLKGGDPFVFGRTCEEILALQREGVPYEIVPGVTSAVAVPAAAGIPLTCRNAASGFIVETGCRAAGRPPRLAWLPPEARITRVILMPRVHLGEIVRQLRMQGYAAHTPAALIESGTTPRQRRWITRLGDLASVLERDRPGSPVLLVVGPAVTHAHRWHPERNHPIGQRVWVPWVDGLGTPPWMEWWDRGYEPVVWTFGRMTPDPDTCADVMRSVTHAARVPVLVFASSLAVRTFFQGLRAIRADIRSLAHVRMIAGNRTAYRALIRWGIRPERTTETADPVWWLTTPLDFEMPRTDASRMVMIAKLVLYQPLPELPECTYTDGSRPGLLRYALSLLPAGAAPWPIIVRRRAARARLRDLQRPIVPDTAYPHLSARTAAHSAVTQGGGP